jgi:hypothetical protein
VYIIMNNIYIYKLIFLGQRQLTVMYKVNTIEMCKILVILGKKEIVTIKYYVISVGVYRMYIVQSKKG